MIHILVDFDNFFQYGTDDNFSWILNELNYFVDQAFAINKKPNFIDIRLYGGWMENGVLTNAASRIQMAVTPLNYFPIVDNHTIIHGKIEIITRLSQIPNLEWDNTTKTRHGLPRIRLKKPGLPERCIGNNENCPVRILYRFLKSKSKICPVSGCGVTNHEAFKIIEQKMVDAMLSCDIISLSTNNLSDGIIILSDDFDLLPPIAIAATNYLGSTKTICLIRNNKNCDDRILNELIQIGLKLIIRS